MIVKTAVCVGNGTWLPQVSCGEDDCTVGTDSEGSDSKKTDSGGTYLCTYIPGYTTIIISVQLRLIILYHIIIREFKCMLST